MEVPSRLQEEEELGRLGACFHTEEGEEGRLRLRMKEEVCIACLVVEEAGMHGIQWGEGEGEGGEGRVQLRRRGWPAVVAAGGAVAAQALPRDSLAPWPSDLVP